MKVEETNSGWNRKIRHNCNGRIMTKYDNIDAAKSAIGTYARYEKIPHLAAGLTRQLRHDCVIGVYY